jgi:type I restriction enzyme, S subunit
MDEIQDLTQAIESKIDRSTWKTWKFSELAENIVEKVAPKDSGLKQYIGLEHLDSGSLHIKRFGETASLVGDKLKIYKGDLIFAKRNAYLKRVAIAEFDAVASAHSMVLRAKPENVLPEFLPFFMLSVTFWEKAIEISVGSLSPTINWKALAKQEFLLPPKEQQLIISSLLWSCDNVYENHLKAIQNIDILFQSVFHERCNKTPVKKEYQIKDLLIDGPRNGFSPISSIDGEGARTVSIGAVTEGVFRPEGNIKYAKVGDDILEKFDVQVNDVFVVRGNGNKMLCGRAGLSKQAYTNLFYPDLLIRLRFDDSIVLPEFATIQWNSLKAHRSLLKSAKSTNGIWKVNGDDIKRHKLIIPPVNEQKKIMSDLASIDARLQLCKKMTTSSEQLLKSLINQFF